MNISSERYCWICEHPTRSQKPHHNLSRGFLDSSNGKESDCNTGDLGSIPGLGWEDPLKKEMATHSSTIAWKIPWAEEPGSLQSMGVVKSQTQLSNFTFTFHFHALEKEMATHSSVLAWRIPGTGSLVGCCLWGRRELDMTEAT